MGNMRFKVGDRVRIKSLDWYNENKNKTGDVPCGEWNFTKWYTPYCGEVMTIRFIWEDDECYKMVNSDYHWTDEMIECKVEEETKPKDFTIKATDTKGKVEIVIPDGYGYEIENDKLYFIKKKKEYPKTYEECCEIVKVEKEHTLEGATIRINYKIALLESFQKLLICRDAYWKIAGEENKGNIDYVICNVGGKIISTNIPNSAYNHILIFPTEEMRDAFYENFKELIESVKELL